MDLINRFIALWKIWDPAFWQLIHKGTKGQNILASASLISILNLSREFLKLDGGAIDPE